MLERSEGARAAVRIRAIWLEELPREARARKAALLDAWVDAAEALRAAVHLHESERGPLVESLFPEWRGPSLRRHLDQALAAEAELQRRLTSSYVVRRFGEKATEIALRPALDALEAARRIWTAERDRPSLAGDEAELARNALHDHAEETSRALDRVRSIVRAALAARPDLADEVFPRRTRPPEGSAVPSTAVAEDSAPPAADERPEGPEASPASAGASAPPTSRTRRRRSRAATSAPAPTDPGGAATTDGGPDPGSARPGGPSPRGVADASHGRPRRSGRS